MGKRAERQDRFLESEPKKDSGIFLFFTPLQTSHMTPRKRGLHARETKALVQDGFFSRDVKSISLGNQEREQWMTVAQNHTQPAKRILTLNYHRRNATRSASERLINLV